MLFVVILFCDGVCVRMSCVVVMFSISWFSVEVSKSDGNMLNFKGVVM